MRRLLFALMLCACDASSTLCDGTDKCDCACSDVQCSCGDASVPACGPSANQGQACTALDVDCMGCLQGAGYQCSCNGSQWTCVGTGYPCTRITH